MKIISILIASFALEISAQNYEDLARTYFLQVAATFPYRTNILINDFQFINRTNGTVVTNIVEGLPLRILAAGEYKLIEQPSYKWAASVMWTATTNILRSPSKLRVVSNN